jgi:hypothetical protein
MKKIVSIFMAMVLVFSLAVVPAFATTLVEEPHSHAETLNSHIAASTYTVDDIRALEPYVNVVDGRFHLDAEQALADGFDAELVDMQIHAFEYRNAEASVGKIIINPDLSVTTSLRLRGGIKNVRHSKNCGGGINTVPEHFWWGFASYSCDCETSRNSADLNSIAAVTAGVALVSGIFGPVAALPAGLTSAYFWLLASRLDANNYGEGVYVEMTPLLVFDITPQ